MAWSLGGLADTSRVDHYEGQAAQPLDEALDHLAEYNERLAATIDNDELTPSELNEIHQLIYTLENALERVRVEVAATLEEVPIASEQAQALRVQEKGAGLSRSVEATDRGALNASCWRNGCVRATCSAFRLRFEPHRDVGAAVAHEPAHHGIPPAVLGSHEGVDAMDSVWFRLRQVAAA